jgi:hypothetical protein
MDLARLVTEIAGRATNVGRLAPRSAATALRLNRIITDIDSSRAKHSANNTFSAQGQRDLIKKDLEKIAPRLGLTKAAAIRNRDAIANNRAALEKEALSKYESDAIAGEIRAMLRTLTHGQAVQEASKDPRVLAAIVNGPVMLHGVEPRAVAHLVQGHLESHHQKGLEKLAAQEEACAASEAALEIATNLFIEAGQFPTGKAFQDFLQDHAPTPADIKAEANGGVASGQPKLSMTDSFQLINSDAMTDQPA